MKEKKEILSQQIIQFKLERLALEVAENLGDEPEDIVLIGIRNNGYIMANMMATLIQPYFQQIVEVNGIAMNKQKPEEIKLDVPFSANGKCILLIDDVANTGRTLLYALKPLLQQYPKRIQTMVLIERMHKLFSIKPDYVGLSLATTLQEHIVVEMDDHQIIGAYLL
ncbi:MAG: phosphoribosyltransferase [Hydrotalea flava]|uniref:phosphoribosyltransferase family protein n=1 Tax=Hydrotalea lipotrueae TaxID=2803817 RepID=UPI00169EA1E0|nr:phosphoribosyltransferase family protein [Hydrotalea lipotrueae]NIM34050.1 phosphoribosyltransferase [Hydrotalea flava]NIM37252.1 phosphoribosyltransferase [Hydrotalea flava]NIN02065.1 phosphoribosyltransferase [Hydrotalea flava]NIN14097.1 phosphoribosyltransferase [Hydrotalea flava]NIO93178.1 phosphoribosyltransferase [Hydrotalea flava]